MCITTYPEVVLEVILACKLLLTVRTVVCADVCVDQLVALLLELGDKRLITAGLLAPAIRLFYILDFLFEGMTILKVFLQGGTTVSCVYDFNVQDKMDKLL